MKTNYSILERVKNTVPASKWGFIPRYMKPADCVPYYVNGFHTDSFKLYHATYTGGDFLWAVYEPGDERPEAVWPTYSMQLNDPRLLRGSVLEMYMITTKAPHE